MPTTSEKNLFRRLVGDYGSSPKIADSEITSYLDDATAELTADFRNSTGVSAPVTQFDMLVTQFHPEVIYYAAIQWWWNRLSKLADQHSQNVGPTSQNVSEKWDRAMKMIEFLTQQWTGMQTLGQDVLIGNLSRFSKRTLMRQGGQSEEDALAALQ